MHNLHITKGNLDDESIHSNSITASSYDSISGKTILALGTCILATDGSTCTKLVDEHLLLSDSLIVLCAKVISTLAGYELTVVRRDGSILSGLYNNDSASVKLECMGRMSSGKVLAAAWNPEGTLLAILEEPSNDASPPSVTLLNNYLEPVMPGPVSISPEIVSKFSLSNANPPASPANPNMVSVGWGKKETQFHGRAGKLASQTSASIDDSLLGAPFETTIESSSIVWHPEGSFFAVSTVLQNRMRKLVIFEHTGQCYAVSEPTEGLYGNALAWKPSSGDLIAAVRHVEGKGSCVVFFERNGLQHGGFSLRRNAPPEDAVVVKHLQWNADGSVMGVMFGDGVLELWTQSNYHWYLKQQMLPGNFAWHLADPRLLFTTSHTGIRSHWVDAGINREPIQSEGLASGTVAVVDGCKVCLTFFWHGSPPPPLFHAQLAFDHAVNKILRVTGNEVKALLADGAVVEQKFSFDGDALVTTTLEPSSPESVYKDNNGRTGIPGSDHWISLDPLNSTLFMEPQHFPILSGCSSFLLVDGLFVVATCFQDDTCHFYPLQSLLSDPSALFPSASKTGGEDEFSRKVERGAKIVTAVPSQASLILQMPRGNLEVIYPRALVLHCVRSLLDKQEFGEAYAVARRHRVDLNFLVDCAQPHLKGPLVTDKFVSEIIRTSSACQGSFDRLNVLLTALTPQDTTKTKYCGSSRRRFGSSINRPNPDKVALVANAVLEACQRLFSSAAFEPILTALLVQGRTTDALSYLRQLTAKQANVEHDEFLDGAIKYLLFVEQPKRLYEAALGIYDLPLALSIARRCPSMDPKEYEQFLANIHSIKDADRRKFAIEDHLGNRGKACQYLYAFDKKAFVAYVQQHACYLAAFEISDIFGKNGQDTYKTLMRSFAEHLCKKEDTFSAAMAYREAQEPSSIFALVKSNLHLWRNAFLADLSRAHFLSDLLGAAGMYRECHYISCKQQAQQSDISAEIALKGGLWDELRYYLVALGDHKKDAIEARALGEHGRFMSRLAEDFTHKPAQWWKRMQAAQDLLLHRCCVELTSDEQSDILMRDDMSETTVSTLRSGLSKMSTASRLSTKSKKRADKAWLRDKPGSKHERQFLHNALHETILNLNQMSTGEDYTELLALLVECGYYRQALEIHKKLKETIKALGGIVSEFNASEEQLGPLIDTEHPLVSVYLADVPLKLTLTAPIAPPKIAFFVDD